MYNEIINEPLIQAFPKVGHSINAARVVLVECIIGSVVELIFFLKICQRFGQDFTRF